MDSEVLAKVIQMAADQVGVDPKQVSAESHFVNDLNYDSLDHVDFAMKIEDEFGVSVPDEDVDRFKFVRDVADYISANRQPKPAAT